MGSDNTDTNGQVNINGIDDKVINAIKNAFETLNNWGLRADCNEASPQNAFTDWIDFYGVSTTTFCPVNLSETARIEGARGLLGYYEVLAKKYNDQLIEQHQARYGAGTEPDKSQLINGTYVLSLAYSTIASMNPAEFGNQTGALRLQATLPNGLKFDEVLTEEMAFDTAYSLTRLSGGKYPFPPVMNNIQAIQAVVDNVFANGQTEGVLAAAEGGQAVARTEIGLPVIASGPFSGRTTAALDTDEPTAPAAILPRLASGSVRLTGGN